VVVAREAAVLADVDALVRKVQRSEHAHGLAEVLLRHLLRGVAKRLQVRFGSWREKCGKVAQALGSAKLEDSLNRLRRGSGCDVELAVEVERAKGFRKRGHLSVGVAGPQRGRFVRPALQAFRKVV